MELEKICRTCLGFAGPFLSIYDRRTSTGKANCIADMLVDLTRIRPKLGDNLPEKVCITCISEINRCYSFKAKCENSNKTLRQLIPDAESEDELVLKPKVKLENKTVQTSEELTKNVNSVEIQTGADASDTKISTALQTALLQQHKEKSKKDPMVAVPAKKIKLEKASESKRVQASPTNVTKKSRIKKELVSKEAATTEEFVMHLENLNAEEIIVPTSTNNVQDNNVESGGYEIFEEYVFDDEHESFSNTKDSEFTQMSDDEDEQCEFDRLYAEAKENEGLEVTVVNAADTEDDDQDDSKEHVEYHISICNETDEAKASKDELSYKRADYQCPHCVMCFVSIKNLNKHVMKRHRMSIVETQAEGQNGKIEDVIEIGMDTQTSNASGDSGNEPKKRRKQSPRTKIINEPEPAIIESEPKDMQYTCDICKSSFALSKSLLFHTRLNACNLKSYSCSECGRVFITEETLIKHKSTHVLSNTCDECHKVFPSKEELSQHMIEDHKRKVRNQCTICSKVFTMLSTLRDHMRIHTGEKPFLCTICGRGFSQNTNLKQHMLRHNENKPFKCDECPNSYCTKAEYYSHKRTHTGDQPFKCDFCDARFTSNSSMNKHRRKHTGERPYACDLCPMRFACLNVMKNHRRTHTGEKPYKCSFCPKVFTQKGDCLNHQRTHLRGTAETSDIVKAKTDRNSIKQSIKLQLDDNVSEEELLDEQIPLQENSSGNEVELVELTIE